MKEPTIVREGHLFRVNGNLMDEAQANKVLVAYQGISFRLLEIESDVERDIVETSGVINVSSINRRLKDSGIEDEDSINRCHENIAKWYHANKSYYRFPEQPIIMEEIQR